MADDDHHPGPRRYGVVQSLPRRGRRLVEQQDIGLGSALADALSALAAAVDAVADAYMWWLRAGRPDRDRFGFAVTSDRQYIWLDDPAGPNIWELSADG